MTFAEFITLEIVALGSYLIGVYIGYTSAPSKKVVEVTLTNEKQGCDIIA